MKNETDEPDYLQKVAWPDGTYQFRLQSCSLQKSRKGNRMVVVEHYCTEGKKKGQVLREYKMLNTDTATGFFMMWVENLGYEVPAKSADLEKLLDTIQSDAPCYTSEVRTRNGLTDTYINPAQEDDEKETEDDWDSARDMLRDEDEPAKDLIRIDCRTSLGAGALLQGLGFVSLVVAFTLGSFIGSAIFGLLGLWLLYFGAGTYQQYECSSCNADLADNSVKQCPKCDSELAYIGSFSNSVIDSIARGAKAVGIFLFGIMVLWVFISMLPSDPATVFKTSAPKKIAVDPDYGPPITDGVPSGPPEGERDLAWPSTKSQPITSKRKATKSRPQRTPRVPRTCTKCGGAGLLTCTRCDGNGYLAAGIGKGYVLCWKCKGTTKITCHICRGRGTR